MEITEIMNFIILNFAIPKNGLTGGQLGIGVRHIDIGNIGHSTTLSIA